MTDKGIIKSGSQNNSFFFTYDNNFQSTQNDGQNDSRCDFGSFTNKNTDKQLHITNFKTDKTRQKTRILQLVTNNSMKIEKNNPNNKENPKDIIKIISIDPKFVKALDDFPNKYALWGATEDLLLKKLEHAVTKRDNNKALQLYTMIVDSLYDKSGLKALEQIIDKANSQKNLNQLLKKDLTQFLSFEKKLEATNIQNNPDEPLIIFNWVKNWKDELAELSTVPPEDIPILEEYRKQQEINIIENLKKRVINKFAQDRPLYYWILAYTIFSNFNESRTISDSPYVYRLCKKAQETSHDRTMQILFEMETLAGLNIYTTQKKWDSFFNELQSIIKNLIKSKAILKNLKKDTSKVDENIDRAYTVLARAWLYRFLNHLNSTSSTPESIKSIIYEFQKLLRQRIKQSTPEEALIYLECGEIISSQYSIKGGIITSILWSKGLSSAKDELRWLDLLQNDMRACVKQYVNNGGNPEHKEKMAEIAWNTQVEAYISAGIPKQGLLRINSSLIDYINTNKFKSKIYQLKKQYPWLVKDNKITLDQVGSHGDLAYDITVTAFYNSDKISRETGIPIATTLIGSLGGPFGSTIGSICGKGINRLLNVEFNKEAQEILDEAKATGIPLITSRMAETLKNYEIVSWITSGIAGAATYKFSRSFLSFLRATGSATFNFIRNGGIRSIPQGLKALGTNVYAQLAELGVNGPHSIPYHIGGKIFSAIEKSFRISQKAIIDAGGKATLTKLLWHFFWKNNGSVSRLAIGGVLIYQDIKDDAKLDTWYGPLGLGILLNEVYGWWVWGWNPNAGLWGFAWRYGFEWGIQCAQGVPLSKPKADYMFFGLLASYTLRGANKLWTLGEKAAKESIIIKRILKFVKKYNVIVPQSVVSKSGSLKLKNGMIPGAAIGAKEGNSHIKTPTINMKNGERLGAQIIDSTKPNSYQIRIWEKALDKSGNPISIYNDIFVKRSTKIGQWLSNTTYNKMSDTIVYRSLNFIGKKLPTSIKKTSFVKKLRLWLSKLGDKTTTRSRPIFNTRGSIANAQILPLVYIVGHAGGDLQGADPVYSGMVRTMDYGIAFFLQHRIQHLLKIDSVISTNIGYALGFAMFVFALPDFFPTKINHAPGLEKYHKALTDNDNVSSNNEYTDYWFKHSISSKNILHYILDDFSPFGSVKDSIWQIEDKGVSAFFKKMTKWTTKAEKEFLKLLSKEDLTNKSIKELVKTVKTKISFKHNDKKEYENAMAIIRFIDNVHNEWKTFAFISDHKEAINTRLLMVKLAYLKNLSSNSDLPLMSSYAKSILDNIKVSSDDQLPLIKRDIDIKWFTQGLNIDTIMGHFPKEAQRSLKKED